MAFRELNVRVLSLNVAAAHRRSAEICKDIVQHRKPHVVWLTDIDVSHRRKSVSSAKVYLVKWETIKH